MRLWVVSMVDSDGSVDDPDAPNQITEGSRRQRSTHSAFVLYSQHTIRGS